MVCQLVVSDNVHHYIPKFTLIGLVSKVAIRNDHAKDLANFDTNNNENELCEKVKSFIKP